jgi:hypothetical protein
VAQRSHEVDRSLSCEKVANACGSGLFGMHEKVSDAEKAYLAQLKATLAVQ